MASSALVLVLQSNSMERKRRVAVVGAGLGGLSIAGFLERAGFPVIVYEQAPTFSCIRAGIIVSATLTKALRRLDVEDAVVATGIQPHCYISRAWDTGSTMYNIVFDAESETRYRSPYLNIHRGDLHAVLKRVVSKETI